MSVATRTLAVLALACVVSLSYGHQCCSLPPRTQPHQTVVTSPLPHKYLSPQDLPRAFDWRGNGTPGSPNLASRVLTQQAPRVCGSCWAEAAMGALSDRFTIATHGVLRVQLAPQLLLNFVGSLSGGSCMGGAALDAYNFTHVYGVTDDTCAPFLGMNYGWGFTYATGGANVSDARAHMCHLCRWGGNCEWVDPQHYDVYTADEFGEVHGVHEMMAEIYARGPIACSINSDPNSFNFYNGGIITDPLKTNSTDHVIVLAGWGETEAGLPYWIGRNSYGTRWGEGAGGGWFRIARGNNTLAIETFPCAWAVPAASNVARAMAQAKAAL